MISRNSGTDEKLRSITLEKGYEAISKALGV